MLGAVDLTSLAEGRQFDPVPDHIAPLICGNVTWRNRVRRPLDAHSASRASLHRATLTRTISESDRRSATPLEGIYRRIGAVATVVALLARSLAFRSSGSARASGSQARGQECTGHCVGEPPFVGFPGPVSLDDQTLDDVRGGEGPQDVGRGLLADPARSSKRLARWRAAAAVPAARWASISSANSFRTASPVAAWASTTVTSRCVRCAISRPQPGVEGQRLARVGGGR